MHHIYEIQHKGVHFLMLQINSSGRVWISSWNISTLGKGGTFSPLQFLPERFSLIACQPSQWEVNEGLQTKLISKVSGKEEGWIFLLATTTILVIVSSSSSSILFNFCARTLLDQLVFVFMVDQPLDLKQSEAILCLVFQILPLIDL